jgi:hypothetical protein
MDTPAALASDLRILTDALDPPRADLETQLRDLIAQIRFANESFLGLSVTIVSGGEPFTILTFDTDAVPEIRSSARLNLAGLCDVESGSALVLYASAPDSFAEFAVDLAPRLDVAADAIVLDAHLVPPVRTTALTEIAATQRINQAVGVLIDRGFPPPAARVELHRRAAVAGTSLE